MPDISRRPRRDGRGRHATPGALIASLLCCGVMTARAQGLPRVPLDTARIDALAQEVRSTFHVPGLAIGIVRDGRVVYARGYGTLDGPRDAPVDARTMFGIGSNTKAFTAAALGILADEKKLSFATHVEDVLAEFRLADPWLTREFRISDLLTHHSGMGLGAGDLLLFSRSTFTRADLLPRLRYMPFSGAFRQDYAYNNLLYAVAGVAIERAGGMPWEQFVQSRIIDAARMPDCTTTPSGAPAAGLAVGHSFNGGVLRPTEPDILTAAAPAGGIVCSVDGMTVWMRLLLAGGVAPNGRRILSDATRDALWAPHALMALPATASMTDTHVQAYGYGWFVEDFHGQKRAWHTGTVSGMTSLTSMLPDRHDGVVVLTNQEDHAATRSLTLAISEMLLGLTPHDWVGYYRVQEEAARARPAPAFDFAPLTAQQARDYIGTYRDAWRGDIVVSGDDHGLRLTFSHARGLTGILRPIARDLLVVRWDNRAMDGADDSFVQFHRDMTAHVTDMTMRVIDHDFSFDVQDLHPVKVAAGP